VRATTNKVCGSGMKATMLAFDLIRAGSARVAISGSMESMSNAPYLLQRTIGAHGTYRSRTRCRRLEDADTGG
jgi:acetyl-CoA acetyltransferase